MAAHRRTTVLTALLALLAALTLLTGCPSMVNVSSFASPGQEALMNSAATFHVTAVRGPNNMDPLSKAVEGLIESIFGAQRKTKDPYLDQMVAGRVGLALQAKGLTPRPRGQASLEVLATYGSDSHTVRDYKGVYNEKKEKYEYEPGWKTKYRQWIRIIVMDGKARSGGKPVVLWQGESFRETEYSNMTRELDLLIVGALSKWGQSTLGPDRVSVDSDNPMLKALEQAR